MKKLTLAFVVFALPTLSLAAFNDVPAGHANADAISYVQANAIVNGYPDETFRPDAPINRAELAKILVAANFSEELVTTCNREALNFSDVPADSWFAPFVCTARAASVIKGYDDGTFRPAQNVKFAEAAKMITLSFGNQVEANTEVWFAPYMEILSQKKAIPTSIGSFEKNITRGEMAEMVYRLRAEVENKDSQRYEDNQLKGQSSASVNTEATVEAESDQVDLGIEAAVKTGTDARYISLDQKEWDNALGKKMIALFFHADWCPTCRTADAEISERVSELPNDSIVFKVDYDTATNLRQEFGVTQQHTVVFINTDQKATLRKSGFSFQDLVDNL